MVRKLSPDRFRSAPHSRPFPGRSVLCFLATISRILALTAPEPGANRIGEGRWAAVVIPGHHYQRDDVIRFADYRADR
jgi:hypothetical protein